MIIRRKFEEYMDGMAAKILLNKWDFVLQMFHANDIIIYHGRNCI
jgi:hypothetical protein